MIKLAVIGASSTVFEMHQPAFSSDTLELVGLCDINAEPGIQRSKLYSVPFFSNYAEMLQSLKPDIVTIMTPPHNHACVAIDAIRFGCHVMLEKPISIYLSDVKKIAEEASKYQKHVSVFFQYRYQSGIKKVIEIVKKQEIGKITRIELAESWFRAASYYNSSPWRGTWEGEGGGVLMNQAPHGLDLICYLLGLPNRVQAWTQTQLHQITTEDTALAMIQWPHGAWGTVFFTTAETGSHRLHIHGTKGNITLENDQLIINKYTEDLRDYVNTSVNAFFTPSQQNTILSLDSGYRQHDEVYRNMCNAIQFQERLATPSLHDAYLSLKLAKAIQLSAKLEKAIDVEDSPEFDRRLDAFKI